MGKNLAGKSAFIVAVLVIFCFGIVGIPHGGLTQSIKPEMSRLAWAKPVDGSSMPAAAKSCKQRSLSCERVMASESPVDTAPSISN